MKKLMKALALALAMCLVLSTAAFAEAVETDSAAEVTNYAEKILTVTVDTTDATSTEAVSLVIVNEDGVIANGNILFVDQKPAVGGKASFTAKIAANVEKVDIYAGNATYAGKAGAAELVANDFELVEQEEEIQVDIVTVTGDIAIVNGSGEVESGTAVGATFDVGKKIISKVIWGFEIDGVKYYTPALDDYATLSGEVQLAVAVKNGYSAGEEPIPVAEIDKVSAIFLYADMTEAFTDAEDAGNRLRAQE